MFLSQFFICLWYFPLQYKKLNLSCLLYIHFVLFSADGECCEGAVWTNLECAPHACWTNCSRLATMRRLLEPYILTFPNHTRAQSEKGVPKMEPVRRCTEGEGVGALFPNLIVVEYCGTHLFWTGFASNKVVRQTKLLNHQAGWCVRHFKLNYSRLIGSGWKPSYMKPKSEDTLC